MPSLKKWTLSLFFPKMYARFLQKLKLMSSFCSNNLAMKKRLGEVLLWTYSTLSSSGSSKLLSRLLEAEIIEPVSGQGKGDIASKVIAEMASSLICLQLFLGLY